MSDGQDRDQAIHRCQNCHQMHHEFICAHCLNRSINDNRFKLLTVRRKAKFMLNQISPMLVSLSELNSNTQANNISSVQIHHRVYNEAENAVSILLNTVEATNRANISRRSQLDFCRNELAQAESAVESADVMMKRMRDGQIVIDRFLSSIRLERRKIIKFLLENFYSIKRVSLHSCSIASCTLPDDCFDLYTQLHSAEAQIAHSMVAALGYTVFVTLSISAHMKVKLPHPLTYFGAESRVTCERFGKKTQYFLSLSSSCLVFQTALDILDQDVRFICIEAGLSESMVSPFSFLPNLLMLLEAVNLSSTRQVIQEKVRADTPSSEACDELEEQLDFVIVD